MVDVLCCALGCVILLWQVSYQEAIAQKHEAETQTAAAIARAERLSSANLQINALTSNVADLKVALDASNTKKMQVTLELADTRKALDKAEKLSIVRKKDYDALMETHVLAQAVLEKLRGDYKDLAKKSAELEKKSTLTAEELAEKIKANADLLTKIAAAETKVRSLEKDVDVRKLAMTTANKELDEKSAKLLEVERLANLLGKDKLELLAKLKTADLRARVLEDDLARIQGESTAAGKRVAELLRNEETLNSKLLISAKDLDTAKAALANAKTEIVSIDRRAKAAENRFAGITLTGQKVIFLVDMSGSMELIDENTAEPDKWPLVCDTVARLMTSLNDLKQFQVILFSDKVRYPLGNEGGWYNYRSKDDAATVAARLKAIKPVGETNMYDAFNEIFTKFRPQGVDTIYFLSDGLPNAGVGLPANANTMTEAQVTAILSKQIRQKLKNDWNRAVAGQPRVKINTIGFFFESPDVGAFLWALAREHEGSFVGMSKP
jgi:hypothetical protein